MKKKYLINIKKNFFWHNINFAKSGINRQSSSKKGIFFLTKFKPKKVLIHDSARPLATNKLIKKYKLLNSRLEDYYLKEAQKFAVIFNDIKNKFELDHLNKNLKINELQTKFDIQSKDIKKIKEYSNKLEPHLENIKNQYKKFKSTTVNTKMTLQKLTNRSIDLYLTDKNYKNTVETHDNLIASGSNL